MLSAKIMDYLIVGMIAALSMAGCGLVIMYGYGYWLFAYLIVLIALCWRAWAVGNYKQRGDS